MRVKTETAGKTKDVNLLEVTPENFIVPKGEEQSYHCRIEVVKFNQQTGERISRPRMQVFGKKAFETSVLHNLRKMGYKVDILHDPNVWIAANKEKIAADKAAKAEAEAKAMEEAKAAERAAIREEIIAELKASGVIPSETAKKSGRKKQDSEATTENPIENEQNVTTENK